MTTATGQHVPLALSDRAAGASFAGVRVCLIGGQRIIRSAIQDYLRGQGVEVTKILEDELSLAAIGNGGPGRANLLVLIVSGGAFRTFFFLTCPFHSLR